MRISRWVIGSLTHHPMTRRALATALVFASTIGPAACGANEPTASRSGLDGTWGIDVAEKDTTKEAGASPGRWTLEIESGDATFYGPQGRTVPLHPTELSETRMVVPPDPTCPNNRPKAGKGTYDVDLSGDALRFTELKDPCGDRAFTFTVHTWRRKG